MQMYVQQNIYFNRALGESLKHVPLIIGLIFEQLGEG